MPSSSELFQLLCDYFSSPSPNITKIDVPGQAGGASSSYFRSFLFVQTLPRQLNLTAHVVGSERSWQDFGEASNPFVACQVRSRSCETAEHHLMQETYEPAVQGRVTHSMLDTKLMVIPTETTQEN